jgi:hypothetical protein
MELSSSGKCAMYKKRSAEKWQGHSIMKKNQGWNE